MSTDSTPLDEVTFSLPDARYEPFHWTHVENTAISQVPLTLSISAARPDAQPMAADGVVPRFVYLNGYMYVRDGGRANPVATAEEVADWRARALPAVDAVLHAMDEFDAAALPAGARGTALARILEEWQAAFVSLHVQSNVPTRRAAERLVDGLATHWGETRREDAHALLGGFPNASSARASALWALSRLDRLAAHEAELRTAAQTDEVLRGLLDLLPLAQLSTPVTEDHNLLGDQRLYAGRRQLWLRLGADLVASGALRAVDDVFYCEFHELCALLDGTGTIPPIEERRARQLAWRAAEPPSFLGAAAPGVAGTAGAAPDTLRGQAASPGAYTGQARVIATIEDAGRLQRGEVLVCPVTTPEWTPYFAIAAALVTNIGGVLSHGGIVAREVGIPAVVDVRGATTAIRDGQRISVDGSTGTVRLLD